MDELPRIQSSFLLHLQILSYLLMVEVGMTIEIVDDMEEGGRQICIFTLWERSC